MEAGVLFIQWDSYAGGPSEPPFFAEDPLTFNTRQERLHRSADGDRHLAGPAGGYNAWERSVPLSPRRGL